MASVKNIAMKDILDRVKALLDEYYSTFKDGELLVWIEDATDLDITHITKFNYEILKVEYMGDNDVRIILSTIDFTKDD